MRLPASHPPAGRSGAPPLRVPAAVRAAVVVTLPALVAAGFPALGAAWELDRAAFAAGEWWRLVTCHWAHWTVEHVLWDAVAMAVLAFLCWERAPRRTLATLAVAAVAVPAAVLVLLPDMTHYRGLSGLDSALYVLLAAMLIREALARRRPTELVLPAAALVLFAAKVGFELVTGASVFAESTAFAPVPLAHAVGAVIALGPGLSRTVPASTKSGPLARCAPGVGAGPPGRDRARQRTERALDRVARAPRMRNADAVEAGTVRLKPGP